MKKVSILSRWALVLAVGAAVGVCAVPSLAVAAGTTTRVSVPYSWEANDDGGSSSPSISSDGRYVAFAANTPRLVPGDTNEAWDVFVRDRVAGVTTRVSVSSSGAQANGDSGNFFEEGPRISADGRYVAFYSVASNLVAGVDDGVFVHDRVSGATTCVSVNSVGAFADHPSCPSISADGRYVAFGCILMPDVTGDPEDAHWGAVWVRDRVAGTTTPVSMRAVGPYAGRTGDGERPSISADGRYVAFQSGGSDLVAGDTNRDASGWGGADIFVRDRTTGTTARVSVSSSGAQSDGWESRNPSISADGRYVAFESAAANLVTGDTNGGDTPWEMFDVFVHDCVTGATTRVNLNSSGAQAVFGAHTPAISSDGRYVAFQAFDSSLVPGDTNEYEDIFVRDRVAGVTTRVSVNSSGAQGLGGSAGPAPAVSGNGQIIAFDSYATNLVSGDYNAETDVFVHEMGSAATGAPTAITIKTTTTSTYIGKTVPLSGLVTPQSMIGVNIVVYVMKPGKSYWTYSSNRTVYTFNGSPASWLYKYYFKPGMARGYYKFKARAPAPGFASSDGFATSESPMITIRVR